MTIYVLLDSAYEYSGAFSSEEKALEAAISLFSNIKGIKLELSKVEKYEDVRFINVYLTDGEYEWNPFLILIREIDEVEK